MSFKQNATLVVLNVSPLNSVSATLFIESQSVSVPIFRGDIVIKFILSPFLKGDASTITITTITTTN